ncbi:hypothetical protein Mapa_005082 [Marchantia paleacea]|nr:hypothetical protein Mapa_005082 [Marchantia paleacea]
MDLRKRTPHVLLVPAVWPGHFTPFLPIMRQLVEHNIGFTICTTQKRVDELREYEADGQFGNVAAEFLVFFRDDSLLIPNSEQLPEHDLLNQFQAHQGQLDISKYTCLISDMFLGFTKELADKWEIPWYSMISTNTSYALLLLHGQAAVERGWHPKHPVRKNQAVELRGLEIFTAGELPDGLSDDPDSYCSHAIGMRTATGLLINTFEGLEKQQLDILRSQLQVMAVDGKVPKVLPIGPLLLLPSFSRNRGEKQNSSKKDPAIQWLDSRSKSSVLYICFGSFVQMPTLVIREVQRGLLSVDVPFLWAQRLPPNISKDDVFSPEFETRTKDRGLLVTDWVPQREILDHPSTGGFMSHCGWNSILESILSAVPILACPVYAEQAMNSRFIVDVLEMAVEMKHSGEFTGEEVAKAAVSIMTGERGGQIRQRMLKSKNAGHEAVAKGGSSHRYFEEFVADISMR